MCPHIGNQSSGDIANPDRLGGCQTRFHSQIADEACFVRKKHGPYRAQFR